MPEHFPLYLNLMWHMHQPYYKDIRTGKYIMPWVRLHATKDYLDMVEVAGEFPEIRSTFNMVPSLMEQLDDYVNHGATDLVQDMTARPANALNDGEKKFLLQKFFSAHYDNMIKPHQRYRELFEKRGWAKTEAELGRAAQYYNEADFRDLQVWYNLAWIDPLYRNSDEAIRKLMAKGRDFSEEDKQTVLRKHDELMAAIAPTYQKLEEKGQIEITCTPFYHPILPLICDTNVARVARPQIALPRHRFSHPEDAVAHVDDAVRFHEKTFGRKPRGMWPAEGSVSPEILPLLSRAGIKWIATDEEILGHSLGQHVRRDLNGMVQNPEMLYRPFYAEHDGAKVAMVFRDHFMSDLIGFQYAGWRSDDAAADLVHRIETAAKHVPPTEQPQLLSIILDGENCWEHYHEDGVPFLRRFYQLLSSSKLVKTTRVCDFLEEFPPTQTLPKLFTGSWINHDFSIWIGHKEDNQSWEYLFEVREAVEAHIEKNRGTLTEQQIATAWKEIFIAEGSDWNWWYGDDHSSGIDEEFDQLYRDHLMSACQSVGLAPPSFLYIPIKTRGITGQSAEPRAYIRPIIDGRMTTYYEWFAAGHYDPTLGGGSMHQAQYLIRRLYYGFDEASLYFRIDGDTTILKPSANDRVALNIYLVTPATWKITIALQGKVNGASTDPGDKIAVLSREESNRFEQVGVVTDVSVGQIVELGIPFKELELKGGDEMYFYVTLEVNGREVERCPVRSPLRMEVPTEDFETKKWVV